jgi:alkylhydroperoxidase family enzyme
LGKEESMPRVREIEEDGDDPILAEVFKKERDIFGGLLNTTKVLAHCPTILRAAKLLGAAIEQSGQLPKALTSLVYLRVASINGCPF